MSELRCATQNPVFALPRLLGPSPPAPPSCAQALVEFLGSGDGGLHAGEPREPLRSDGSNRAESSVRFEAKSREATKTADRGIGYPGKEGMFILDQAVQKALTERGLAHLGMEHRLKSVATVFIRQPQSTRSMCLSGKAGVLPLLQCHMVQSPLCMQQWLQT